MSSDRIDDFLPHALYFCCKSGFELRGRNRTVEDWELSLLGGDLPISMNKSVGEVIQGAPQVVDGVSGNGQQFWRDWIGLEDVDSWIRSFSIEIYSQGIRFGSHKDAKSGFEVLDMFFGPA